MGKERKVEVSRELNILMEMQETNWRQKLRALWLKEGDRCAKFFHRMANSNRKNNSISSLEVGGDGGGSRVEEIVGFYSSLYREPFSWRPFLEDLEFASISGVDVEWMERPFDEEEVMGATRSLNGDKAPGPDGFSLDFFQSCWEVVRETFSPC